MAPEGDPSRANNFNLLRLLLASAVILAHSAELLDGNRSRELLAQLFGAWMTLGGVGVDGFFVLSGYLIAQSWLRDPNFGRYLWKRVTRIYPGYFVACLISTFVLAPFGSNPKFWDEFQSNLFLHGLFTLRVPDIPSAFPDMPLQPINGSMWTIRYEFVCYMGLAVLGLVGALHRRWTILAITVGFTGWAAAQTWHLIPPLPPATLVDNPDVAFPRLVSCFLTGTCFYLFRDKIRFPWFGVVGAAVGLYYAMFREATGSVALPILGGYLLLAAGLARPLPWTGLVRREDVSYGVYLYAWPIQQLFICRYRHINLGLLIAITLGFSLLAGWVSWRLVEQPFLKLKPGRSQSPLYSPSSRFKEALQQNHTTNT